MMMKGTIIVITSLLSLTSSLAKVSLDRFGNFLRDTELLDNFSEETCTEIVPVIAAEHADVIGFNNVTFAWSKGVEDGTQTPSARSFRLQSKGQVSFKKGGLNLVVGPT